MSLDRRQVRTFRLRLAGVARRKERNVLRWSLCFLVLALIAALLGSGLVASVSIGIAKILFFIFIVLFLVSIVAGLARR